MSQTTTPAVNRTQPAPLLREPVIVRVPGPSGLKSRHRTARRTVLWGIAGIALAHLALAASVETVLPQLRDPEYGYRLVRLHEQQRLHPDRPLVLVLGTSRTAYGIDPAAMNFPDQPGSPLVFNFGLAGSRPVHLRLHLQRLHADGVKPAAVLVELLPATLAVPGPADELCAPDSARLTADDLRRLEPYLADPAAFRHRWVKERMNAWQAQRSVLLSHVAPGWQPWQKRLDHYWAMTDSLGFCPYPMGKIAECRESRTESTRDQYALALAHLRVSELSTRAIRDLVADCREAGTPVAFFLAPESPAFRSWYTPQSRAALSAFTRSLAEEFGCPVFAAPEDFAEDDFADGHHMLPGAAARFSRRLADAHLKSWLAQSR